MEDQYRTQAVSLLDAVVPEVLRLIDKSDEWEDLGNDDQVQAYRIITPQGPIVRATGLIKHSAEEVVNFVLDNTKKKLWDEMLDESIILKDFGDGVKIMSEKFNLPWPVSDRDFVFAFKTYEKDDGFLIVAKSIDIGVPERSGVVRGEVVSSAFYIRRVTPKLASVTYLVCVDPKGSIPSMIVNRTSSKQAGNVAKIRKAMG
jgi:START domain